MKSGRPWTGCGKSLQQETTAVTALICHVVCRLLQDLLYDTINDNYRMIPSPQQSCSGNIQCLLPSHWHFHLPREVLFALPGAGDVRQDILMTLTTSMLSSRWTEPERGIIPPLFLQGSLPFLRFGTPRDHVRTFPLLVLSSLIFSTNCKLN